MENIATLGVITTKVAILDMNTIRKDKGNKEEIKGREYKEEI